MKFKETTIDTLITAEDNRAMFNLIARRYDLMNMVLSFGLFRQWRRRAVAALEPCDDKKYLDIGCGTGDMALEILRQSSGASVVGLDPARQMIDVGIQKTSDAGCSESVSFILGDATQLNFADASFSGIVTAYCVRNITHREKALAEMRRVLLPGGKLVILELSTPENRIIRMGHRCYNHLIVPFAGSLIAGRKSAYKYLVDSIENFVNPESLIGMMENAGFINTQSDPLHFGVVTLFIGHVSN